MYGSFLKETILEEKVVEFCFKGSLKKVYPHHLITLKNDNILIAEDLEDQILKDYPLSFMTKLHEVEEVYVPKRNLIEVSEFSHSLRVPLGDVERLILKILDPYHFKEKVGQSSTKVITPKGELIWASSVEKNDELFSWLDEIFPFVEILSPIDLRKEFIEFSLKKIRMNA